jgi:two-component system, NarL family, nitrate/nitrite response regulator NarL
MPNAVELETEVPTKASQGLTSRQVEIAILISQGLSNKEVSRQLNLCEGTVKIHLHNIYTRLGLRNRTALTVFPLRNMRSDRQS